MPGRHGQLGLLGYRRNHLNRPVIGDSVDGGKMATVHDHVDGVESLSTVGLED